MQSVTTTGSLRVVGQIIALAREVGAVARTVQPHDRDLADQMRRAWTSAANNSSEGQHQRGALEAFLKWKADPAGFKFGRSASGSKSKKGTKVTPKVKGQAERDEPGATHTPPQPPNTPPRRETRSFPLDADGNEFHFSLPDRPLSMRDVRRIAIHLASFSVDFDPGAPTDEQVFGLATR